MRRVLLMTAMLTGCSIIPGTSAHMEDRARSVLSETLFDGDTARFKDLRIVEVKGEKPEKIICGQVNAKNRMGGYIGFRNFIVSTVTDFGVIDPQTDIIAPHGEAEIKEFAEQGGFNGIWSYCGPPKPA
jgi:hypothetical protein